MNLLFLPVNIARIESRQSRVSNLSFFSAYLEISFTYSFINLSNTFLNQKTCSFP